MMPPSHTLESTVPVWDVIEANPAVRALFIEGGSWMPWCSAKSQIRILDRNAAAAVHVLPTLAYGQSEAVIEGLRALAWSCHAISNKNS